jgi:alpha-D-ribose 1-methylphosphonate 5-triphosphate synthase subunit PhnH
MPAPPVPSAAETRANAAFEALMWALSRPGLPRTLPEAGPHSVIEALIDRECAVHCADPALAEAVARTGAAPVPMEEADHVFVTALRIEDLPRLRRGSDLYPDDGATVICPARLGEGPPLALTGPGCDGPVRARIGGLPDGLWAARARAMRYPMGFELVFIDGAQVLGVPRSTHVEVG